MNINTIILAAGKGTRMRSSIPKVLHQIGHQSILEHIVDATAPLNCQKTAIVYGHEGEQVKQALSHKSNLTWVEQAEQLGTGHAVKMALSSLSACDVCLILVGDIPLIQTATLQNLVQQCAGHTLSVLSAQMDNPTGYGRIIKDELHNVQAIVEEKDASAEQKSITEINTGVFAIPGEHLASWIEQLDNDNAQQEYYLTDIVKIACAESVPVASSMVSNIMEVSGINNKAQLAVLEREYQGKQAQQAMLSGAIIKDPARIDIRGKLNVGEDTIIDVNNVFIGEVSLGQNVIIEPNCVISNSTIADNTHIKSNSVIEQAIIGEQCDIGPFARVRPGTVCKAGSKLGNFVEIKNSDIGEGSKVNHLSYVGDALIEPNVNVGAGTITCNYDGVNKHKTHIKTGAFIGSNSSLVAPVTIGEQATIAAGSTITKDAPDNALTFGRAKQKTLDNWERPKKET